MAKKWIDEAIERLMQLRIKSERELVTNQSREPVDYELTQPHPELSFTPSTPSDLVMSGGATFGENEIISRIKTLLLNESISPETFRDQVGKILKA